MVESTQLTTYAASIYSQAPTLLPENIASVITAIALATRLSLRCSSILIEALLESVKYSTSFSIGISRQAIINALSTAKKLHDLTLPIKAITDTPSSAEDIDSEKYETVYLFSRTKTMSGVDFYKYSINTRILEFILCITH